MVRLLVVVLLFSAVSCQDFNIIPKVIGDIINLAYNFPVDFADCSDTVVLRSNLTFTLYKQNNPQNGIVLDNTNLQEVNLQNRIIFIIHGWLQSGSQGWVIQMKDEYLINCTANIIVVDWSAFAGINYGLAVCAVPYVGALVGDLIYTITTNNYLYLNNIQINGFSLGAHVAGFAGQKVQVKANGLKIGRINGLDAAGPGYLNIPIDQRLDSTDAWFVQGIHTSDWQFGYGPRYATVDFQVNRIITCGAFQNGCPFLPEVPTTNIQQQLLSIFFCNHIRSVAYFIESIYSQKFRARVCSSCLLYQIGLCFPTQTTIMGEHCPSNVHEEYYLSTAISSPFALG